MTILTFHSASTGDYVTATQLTGADVLALTPSEREQVARELRRRVAERRVERAWAAVGGRGLEA